jgi:hypothetical protein
MGDDLAIETSCGAADDFQRYWQQTGLEYIKPQIQRAASHNAGCYLR